MTTYLLTIEAGRVTVSAFDAWNRDRWSASFSLAEHQAAVALLEQELAGEAGKAIEETGHVQS